MKTPKKARGESPSSDAADGISTLESQSAVAGHSGAPEEEDDAQPAFGLGTGDDDEGDELVDEQPLPPRDPVLTARLSHQLHDRLIRTARAEGVTLEGLVQELLAEGVTLRAWEIIERKGAMRGIQPTGNGPQGGPPNNRNFNSPQQGNRPPGSRGPGNNNGRMSNNRPGRGNNAWMEDKAAFLEYVRNQEKRRR